MLVVKDNILQDWTADKSSVDYRKGRRNQFPKIKAEPDIRLKGVVQYT